MTLYDCTQFIGKPGGDGRSSTGCIPGAVKLEINKPRDNYAHSGAGDSLIHVEPGKDANFVTKPDLKAAKITIDLLAHKAMLENPRCTRWWYCPPLLRAEWLAASKGDKKAQAAIKAWRNGIYSLADYGIPGPRVHGVCIDLYDFSYLAPVWRARVAENIKPWIDMKRAVLPILYLRWKDTGRLYTEPEARERIEFAASLCGGNCAIFDGIDIQDRTENYADWPLRAVVESIARGE